MKPEIIITEQNLPDNVLRAIKQGRKIEAIKLLREETGLGLANAKVLVDRASSKFAPKRPNPAITEIPSGAITLLKMVMARIRRINALLHHTHHHWKAVWSTVYAWQSGIVS